jgi:hypothetical protein
MVFGITQEVWSLDPQRFDALSRALSTGRTRRETLPTTLGGAFGLLSIGQTEA